MFLLKTNITYEISKFKITQNIGGQTFEVMQLAKTFFQHSKINKRLTPSLSTLKSWLQNCFCTTYHPTFCANVQM